jgi:hypothetical protein
MYLIWIRIYPGLIHSRLYPVLTVRVGVGIGSKGVWVRVGLEGIFIDMYSSIYRDNLHSGLRER